MSDHTQGAGPSSYDVPIALAMDLGGNWIRVALVTPSGEILWRERTPTNAQAQGPAIIARTEALLDWGMSQAGDRRIAGVGIGVASPVDPETGIIYNPPNIPGLDGVSFKALVVS